jgi:hypothetical protein
LRGRGGWRYPPDRGFVVGVNGQPVVWQSQLSAGQIIDRYGSEYGWYLAPIGVAYFTRSIPPQNLVGTPAAGCNYHAYKVLRPFTVNAGPSAPWFAQPGGGLQYELDGNLVPGAPPAVNVGWLVDHGYLQRLR